MKIRSCFVSNSSSSSFICDACGSAEESYDGEGHTQCEIGHEFCDYCVKDDMKKVESDDYGYAVTKETCPICTKKIVPDYVKLQYFYDTLGIDSKTADELVRGNINFDKIFRGLTDEK